MPEGPRPSTRPLPLAEIARIAGATRTGTDAADPDPSVTGVTHDSRDVRPGDLYAALPGFRTHGAEFAVQAVELGAVAILTDAAGADRATATGAAVLVVEDPRSQLGAVASAVYGAPSHDLLVVGVTGTNGKTTTSYLVDAGFRAAGHVTGVIGTVGTRIGDDVVPTARTTPEAADVHALLAVMRERGVTAVTMEVSSHALRLGRVDGVRFDVAGFTNLTEDHLDFHRDLEDYFGAKAELFSARRSGHAVVCVDDAWGVRMAEHAVAAGLPTSTYGIHTAADWTAHGVVTVPGGSVLRGHGPHGVDVPVEVRLPGEFNVANALGALALLVAAGVDPLVAADGIASCEGVPGRMERVPDPDHTRGLLAFVDYAHTPDAVARAVSAARDGARGKVVVVLGAGGDRDPHKRPAMGEAAGRGADVVVVTDDNPRSEDPAEIRSAILDGAYAAGSAQVIEVGDRLRAIHVAVHAYCAPGDVLLVLGKGHELGQEIDGVVTPFDDRLVLAGALEPDDEGDVS